MPGVCILLHCVSLLFPYDGITRTGSMGMISARYDKAPLLPAKVSLYSVFKKYISFPETIYIAII